MCTPAPTPEIPLGATAAAPTIEPLHRVSLPDPPATAAALRVRDGRGRLYLETPIEDCPRFTVGGALGWQRVEFLDTAGQVVQERPFRVGCATRLDDPAGFGELLRQLHFTMLACSGGDGLGSARVDGKLYRYFICWLRDHTHTLKGMKYFSGEVKTGLELYADTQRADGMVYERIAPKADVQGWRDDTFQPGGFIRTLNPGRADSYSLQRIPIENDVEFLFIECLYRTWQATGDDAWMQRYLDHARQAVSYATSDPWRWSRKFGLLKRGYTIDTWDFLHHDDARLTAGDNVFDPQKTVFGIMHGDNTGMAMACRMLAHMLRAAGREADAAPYDQLARDLLERLDQTAWDPRGYYRHHISEDPSFRRDVGDTEESSQVSLSNAYALNRGIDPAKARAIIQTYQNIRRAMPAASPGEFFNIYPPFAKGFGTQNAPWQYMNGGVSTLVAGELARGAFAQGDASYGVDILTRLKALADRHAGYLPVCLNGNPQTTPPQRRFTCVDLAAVANVTAVHRAVGGWGDPGNDLSRLPTGEISFHHIPFCIAPQGLGLGLAWDKPGFAREIRVPIGGRPASFYLLHTASQPGQPLAEMEVVYDDGRQEHLYLAPGRQLDSWFMPGSEESRRRSHAPCLPQGWPPYQLAWRGGNDRFDNVGVFVWGWDNPRPQVTIREVVFRAARNASVYYVAGLSLSDHPVWFPQSEVSFGIPDGWGAAAVVYALIEGLAGVVDGATMFETVDLAPQWSAAGIDKTAVRVTYPASDGYLAYDYHHDAPARHLRITSTGSGTTHRWRLPLPPGAARIISFTLNDQPSAYEAQARGGIMTVVLTTRGPGPYHLDIHYA